MKKEFNGISFIKYRENGTHIFLSVCKHYVIKPRFLSNISYQQKEDAVYYKEKGVDKHWRILRTGEISNLHDLLEELRSRHVAEINWLRLKDG